MIRAMTEVVSPREAVACDLCGKDDAAPLVTKNGFRVVRCRECGLVYVSPRPRFGALAAIYDQDNFQAHQVERAEDRDWQKEARARLELINRHKPARGALLDVGCSTGWFMGIARDGGWKVSGIDVSVGSVRYAKSKGFDARVATLDSHDFATASFDVVTMFDSIEHMPSPMQALHKVHELLRDDGIVFITTPNVEGLFPRLTYKVLGRTLGVWEHPTPPGHVFQFGRPTLAAALDRAGFRIEYDQTEAIALDHTVCELEDGVIDLLKGKTRKPTEQDADVEVEVPPSRREAEANAPRPKATTRLARLALRRSVRAAAWTVVHGIAGTAPLLDRGDSLVVIARKR